MKKNKFIFYYCALYSFLSALSVRANISLDELCKKGPSKNAIEYIKQEAPQFNQYLSGNPDSALITLLDFIIKNKQPVLVKFSANWCAPCKKMQTIIEHLDKEITNKIAIVEINIDNYPQLRKAFNVLYIPTLIFFKNAKEIDRTNSLTSEALIAKINALLAN